MTINYICKEHSGCIARLDNIDRENVDQWNKMIRTNEKMDIPAAPANLTLVISDTTKTVYISP